MRSFAILLVFCYSAAQSQVDDFFQTDFRKADSIAELYPMHALKDLKSLSDKLTGALPTEQEKFRAIYRWVCNNIEADYDLVMQSKRDRAQLQGEDLLRWNREFNQRVFKTLWKEYKTTCTGYAYLIRELAFHAGLSCTIINGYARYAGVDQRSPGPVNHSWNEIQLNGKWYVCDATWSSGVFNIRENKFVKRYNDQYFLMEPTLFFQSHQIKGNW
jgi:transglutaminase/protease-like cytokinesis protein 3